MAKVNWKTEEFYASPQEYFRHLSQAVRNARQSIEIESYIFSFDDIGKAVLRDLQDAVARGVRVRLLIDGFGTPDWSWNLEPFCQEHGINFRVFNPLPFPFSRLYWKFLFRPSLFFSFLSRANRRNHRKLVLVDDQKAFVGGINISSTELDWEDAAICVEGEDMVLLKNSFERNWNVSFHPRHPRWVFREKTKIRLNSSLVRIRLDLSSRRKSHHLWVKEIEHAGRRIWLTTGYFVPPLSLLHILKKCVQRGLDVRLLLSAKSDVAPLPWVSRYYFRALLNFGVKIYIYQKRFIHSKYALIDDKALIGSSNLNFRSRYHDQEVDLVVNHPSTIAKMNENYLKCLEHSSLLTAEELEKNRWYQDMIARILLLIKRWL